MLVAQIVRMSQWEGDFYLQEKIIEVLYCWEACLVSFMKNILL